MVWGSRLRLAGCAVAALALCYVVGCTAGKPKAGTTDKAEMDHLINAMKLVRAYLGSPEAKKNPFTADPEKNGQMVKDWAIKNGKGKAEDFVSTRDGQDYVCMPGAMGPTVAEKEGKGGERYVTGMEATGPRPADQVEAMLHRGASAGPSKRATGGR